MTFNNSSSSSHRLLEICIVFLKMGFSAFGGPAAHIAIMENELVEKRKWMTKEHFLDLLGATSLIPGPNSTEMAIHCGFHRGGYLGLILAGFFFISPAVLLTGVLAYFYYEYGQLDFLVAFMFGIKPAVLVLIIHAVYKLGKKALKNNELVILGVIAALINWFFLPEIWVILGGGILGMVYFNVLSGKNKINSFAFPIVYHQFFKILTVLPTTLLAIYKLSTMNIFLYFLKIGAILFGSGYVLIAYLEGDLVNRYQWLTQEQLLDAIAIGQFTPGPVLSTSAFIGFQIDGVSGAIAAAVGIFLPSFIYVAIVNPWIPKLRKSNWASFFLDSVNVCSLAIMAVVSIKLFIPQATDIYSALIFIITGILFLKVKWVNSIFVIAIGGLLGYLSTFLP